MKVEKIPEDVAQPDRPAVETTFEHTEQVRCHINDDPHGMMESKAFNRGLKGPGRSGPWVEPFLNEKPRAGPGRSDSKF